MLYTTIMLGKIVFGAMLFGFIAIRLIFAIVARQTGLSASFEYKREPGPAKGARVIPFVVAAAVLASIVVYFIVPARDNFLVIPVPEWIVWLGAGIGASALALQIVTHAALQKHWSRANADDRVAVVIRTGPYRRIRHPLYLSFIVMLAGLSLATAYVPVLLLAIGSIPLFNREAKKEEAGLRQKCGEEYDAYCRKAGRLWPRMWVIIRREPRIGRMAWMKKD